MKRFVALWVVLALLMFVAGFDLAIVTSRAPNKTIQQEGARTTTQAITTPGILECYHEILPGSASSRPRWTPTIFPVAYEKEPTIIPLGLHKPDEVEILSQPGASIQVIVLMYDTGYLYRIRDQVGASFRGIAPLALGSVPSSVTARYAPDAQYVVAPNSCRL